MLTTEERRARELAARLEQLNRDRQAVEDTILQEAIALVDVASPEWRERHAYVIASQDWHEGVIGIVASRLVERYRRPVVLIAVGDDEAKGSGRSVPGYDLHAGLTSAGDHLLRYGGHKAAAGLTIDASEIPAFAEALARSRRRRVGLQARRDAAPRRCGARAVGGFARADRGAVRARAIRSRQSWGDAAGPGRNVAWGRAHGRGQAPALHRRAGRFPLPGSRLRHGGHRR